MPRVLNKKTHGLPFGAVYIGRPSKWGNPSTMRNQSQQERDRVCDEFEQYMAESPELRAQVKAELKGKDLVCFCAPLRCHGWTLVRIANEGTDHENT